MAILALMASDNQALRDQGKALFYALNLIAIPLFFFCMGMLVQVKNEQRSLLSLIIGTIKVYCIGIALYAPKQIAAANPADISASLHAIFWGTGNALYNTPLWLLTALVPGLCLYRLGKQGGRPLGKGLLGPLIALAIVCLTYWLLSLPAASDYLPHDSWGRPLGLPWNLELAPLVTSMLLLGARYQAHDPASHQYRHNRTNILFLMSMAGLSLLIVLRVDPALDLNYRMIQAWPSALLATFLGLSMSVATAHLTCINACKARHLFGLLGRNGLIILLVFCPIQNALVSALPAEAKGSPFVALAASIVLCVVLAGLSQGLINRYPPLKRIAYV